MQSLANGHFKTFCLSVMFLMTFANAACSAPGDDERCSPPTLQQNKELWTSKHIVSYTFTVTRFGGGMNPYAPMTSSVVDSKNVFLRPIGEITPLTQTTGYEKFATIDDMFVAIEQLCSRGDRVDASYDKDRGYPTDIRVAPKGGGVDSEYRIEIKDVKVP